MGKKPKMKLNEYLYKSSINQVYSHNITFFEGGVGSGVSGHHTDHPEIIGVYNTDAVDDPSKNPAHVDNMTEEQIDRYGDCAKMSKKFVLENGGDLYKSTDGSHVIAVNDNKIYDYVFGINGMPIEEFTSTYPTQFNKISMEDIK